MNSNPYSSGRIYFQDCNNWEDYKIKENDTLYNISVKFGVPIKMLMSCNKNINPYNLQTGQTIKVPGSKPQPLGCREDVEETYTIELRDTLYSISERLETSVEELIQINPGIDPYNLKPGTKICVPKKKTPNNVKPTPTSTPSSPSTQFSMSSQNPSGSEFRTQTSNFVQPPDTNDYSQPVKMTPTASAEIPTKNMPSTREDNYNLKNSNTNSNSHESTEKNAVSSNNSSNFHTMHEMNSGTNSNMNISNTETSPSCPKDCIGKYYITQDSDTLESILDSLDLTYAALAFSNPTVDFCNLYSGIKLCIPHHDMFKGCNSSTAYIIKRGDALSSLAQRFNVPESALLSANPFNKIPDFSTPGIKICIPE